MASLLTARSVINRFRGFFGRGGRLYGDPTNNRRQSYPFLRADHKDLLTQLEHNQLQDASRYLCNQFPAIRGAIRDKANTAIGSGWSPQFTGRDQTWGNDQGEPFLRNWHSICDVRGKPYGMAMNLHTGSQKLDEDGEFFIYLFRTAEGFPMTQWLETHRIGNRNGRIKPYRNFAVRNGIAYNRASRPVAYHYLADDPDADRWIPARDIIHVYDRTWFSQGRGIPPVAQAILDWLDVMEIRANEKVAQRIYSSISLLHRNEKGEVNPYAKRLAEVNATKASLGVGELPPEEERLFEEFMQGGTRALVFNKEDLEAFQTNRPTTNAMEFQTIILRGAFSALGWTYEQSLDASKLGGANVRRDITKNNKSAEHRQLVLLDAYNRINAWAVATAIGAGLLDFNAEWWRFQPQFPAQLTADVGNESRADRENRILGLTTSKDIYAKQGKYWQEAHAQLETEADDFFTRATRLSEKHKKPFDLCLLYLSQRTANGNLPDSTENASIQNTDTENSNNQDT